MKRFLLLLAMVLVGLSAEAQLVRSSALIVTKQELPPVKLGFKNIVDVQGGIFDLDFGGGIHYIAGYRFTEKLLAGVGVGYEYAADGFVQDWIWGKYVNNSMETDIYRTGRPKGAVPIYLHGRYYFSTKEWAPYVGLSAGLYLAKGYELEVCTEYRDEEDNTDRDWNLFEMKRTGGAYADVNIGLNHRITATTDFAVYFGAKLWGMPSYEGTIDAYSTYDDIISGTMTTSAFYLGASITF